MTTHDGGDWNAPVESSATAVPVECLTCGTTVVPVGDVVERVARAMFRAGYPAIAGPVGEHYRIMARAAVAAMPDSDALRREIVRLRAELDEWERLHPEPGGLDGSDRVTYVPGAQFRALLADNEPEPAPALRAAAAAKAAHSAAAGVSVPVGGDGARDGDGEALRALATEFLEATDAVHEMHGSTAVHGGIGGSTVTAHCAYVCGHSAHFRAQERFEKARYELAIAAARSGGTPKCLCDGGSYLPQGAPFLVHTDCPVHAAGGTR